MTARQDSHVELAGNDTRAEHETERPNKTQSDKIKATIAQISTSEISLPIVHCKQTIGPLEFSDWQYLL